MNVCESTIQKNHHQKPLLLLQFLIHCKGKNNIYFVKTWDKNSDHSKPINCSRKKLEPIYLYEDTHLWTAKIRTNRADVSHFDPKPNHFAKKFLLFPREGLDASLVGVWIGNELGLAVTEKLETVSLLIKSLIFIECKMSINIRRDIVK